MCFTCIERPGSVSILLPINRGDENFEVDRSLTLMMTGSFFIGVVGVRIKMTVMGCYSGWLS